MRIIVVVLLLMVLLSCGDDGPELNPLTFTSTPSRTAIEAVTTATSEVLPLDSSTPTPTPTPTVVEQVATATSVDLTPEPFIPTPIPTLTAVEKVALATRTALINEPFYASEECKAARERLAGSDFVMGELKEQGSPTWEERFLDADVVVRAKLVSSHPRVVSILDGKDGERHYLAIAMIFRVFEVFRGSVSLDYIVVWQVGWDYYRSHNDAFCVRPESIANLREDYPYFDDREAVLLLKHISNVEGFENISEGSESISSYREYYFLARLPIDMRPPSLLENEQWRWLPHYEGDSFYDRKYPVDSLESETIGTVTTQELREVGDKIEELRYTHDLDCVYEAYRRARNFNENLEELMKGCAWE